MRIVDYFGSYAAAYQHAAANGITNHSIQPQGQGWQKHKWVLRYLNEE